MPVCCSEMTAIVSLLFGNDSYLLSVCCVEMSHGQLTI